MGIPKLTKAELTRRSRIIRPIFRTDEGIFYQKVDNLDTSLVWDPKPEAPAVGLYTVTVVRTLHTFNYYGMFKPSAAEVLCQIPEGWLDHVVAYELCGPKTADDLNREREAVNAGFHVSETILYGVNKEAVRKEDLQPKTPLAKALLGDDDPFENS